jgi:crotonobetainyl-CoA:carnitine CoA-transferase CaiB-like acyl-CoA transferase
MNSEAKPSGQRTSPLRGVRVVALGCGAASAFAQRWLAALGAEVIALDRSGADAVALLARADLVLDATEEGTDPFFGKRGVSPIPVVRLTPFGVDGPYVGMPHTPFTLAALAGLLWHVGDADRPPLAQWGDQIELLAGLHAFAAALAVLWAGGGSLEVARARGRRGAGRTSHGPSFAGSDRPAAPARGRAVAPVPDRQRLGGHLVHARDQTRVAEVMGLPEIAAAPRFMVRDERVEAVLVPRLEAWFRARTCDEVDALGREQRVPLAAVRTVGEVASSPQLAHRAFFARDASGLRPGRLWRSDAHEWRDEPAPVRDPGAVARALAEPPRAARRVTGPLLDGVRVLDLGQIWAGPYAAMLLADQGADVIKIESPSRWDPNRCAVQPPRGRERDWWNTCAYFQEYSRNKRSLALEIAHPRGREVLAALVRRADVVIENYRAGVLDRLGIGYDWLRAQRGDVILVSMAAFGQTGPDCERPGYGPVMEELSGLASLTGWGDGRPQLAIGYAYGDPVAAAAAGRRFARGAAAAPPHGSRTARRPRAVRRPGRDDRRRVRRVESHRPRAGTAGQPASRLRAARRLPVRGRRRVGRDRRRERCALARAAPRARRSGVGARSRARRRPFPRGARFAARRSDRRVDARQRKSEVFERCIAEGVPAAPVHRTNHELIENPQLRARGFYERVSHPAGGEWWMHGWEWRPAGAGRCVRALAPDFGADNDAVLREVAGLSDREIAALRAEGVIASMPIGVPALPEDR